MTTASVLRCAPERYHDEMDEVQSTWECRVGLVDVLGHASTIFMGVGGAGRRETTHGRGILVCYARRSIQCTRRAVFRRLER